MTDTKQDAAWENLFGVCAAIAEDFGFDPLWLRIPFAVATIFWPVQVIALYFGLGAFALLTRWLVPNRKPAEVVQLPVAAADEVPVELAKAA